MILYFSGTGNSKYVAQRIADALGDTLFNMNDRIKAQDPSPIETGERIVFVTPTYAWRIPRIVQDWLLKTDLIEIVMPENYIAMFNAPQPDKARKIVANAEPGIERAIAAIQADRHFASPRSNLYDRFMSSAVNPIFYPLFVKSDAFTVSSKCVGCGQCVSLCPMNNIALKDGKPSWGKDCTHCMACICYCPAEAIEYGKKSLDKPKYHFEAL